MVQIVTKKTYIKPEILEFAIDKDISLQMTSEEQYPGGPRSSPLAPPPSSGEGDNSFDHNPFE